MLRVAARAAGAELRRSIPATGGDINEAYRLVLSNGRQLFAKLNAQAPPGLFEAEAHGLAWLAEAKALRTPRVIAVSQPGEHAFLLLELLSSARRSPGFDEQLGTGLARLHRFGSDGFGLDRDNFIGRLPQSNTPHSAWPSFYRSERLEPQLRLAADAGRLPKDLTRELGRIANELESVCGPDEPPSRLHGDLWGGNLHVDDLGEPALLDPAPYGGSREVDLAMMRLFGGFSPRVFSAYEEAFPLQPGAERRVALYQLYPLLVHVNHFGAGYVGALRETARRTTAAS